MADPFDVFSELFGPQPSRSQLLNRRRNRQAASIANTLPSTSTIAELVGTEPTPAPSAPLPPPDAPGFWGSIFESIEPVTSRMHDVAKFGSAGAILTGATVTNPFGVFDKLGMDHPIGPFGEFQSNLDRRMDESGRQDLSLSGWKDYASDLIGAQEETEFPAFVKGTSEMVFDPLNIAGGPVIKVAGKGLGPVGRGIAAGG